MSGTTSQQQRRLARGRQRANPPGRPRAWLVAASLALLLVANAVVGAADDRLPLHRWAWQSWSSESGLPQISVKSIVRDHDDLVWIATENGLARFDGSVFQTFDPASTPALAASWINRLLVDRLGRVWVATLRNVAVYDRGRFLGSADVGEIRALAERADGSILVGGDRLWLAAVDGQSVQLQPDPDWDGPVRLLQGDGPRALWIAGDAGELEYRSDAGERRRIALPGGANRAQAMARSRGALWLATDTGLFRQQGQGWQAEDLPGPARRGVEALAVDADDSLWVASAGELLLRHRDGRSETVPSGSPQAFPWTMTFLVESDGLWLGSQYHGLRHYWQPQVQRLGVEDGLSDPSLWSFATDGERLLVGSNSGVAEWREDGFATLVPGSVLPHPAVYSLLVDRSRRLWIGTRAGLARSNADGGELRRFDLLEDVQINGALEAPDGRVWLATAAGLMIAEGDSVQAVGAGSGLDGQRVRSLAYGSDGSLWIGAEAGVFRWQGQQFERIVDAGLDGAFVTSVRVLDDGHVAIGSYDRGIALRAPSGTWRRLTREQGLPSDTVFNLIGHQGALLVSFSDGVYRLRPKALSPDLEARLPVELLLLDEGDRPGRSRIRCCNGAGNDKGALYRGGLWLPSLNGAVRVPLSAQPQPSPSVEIVGVASGQGALPVAPRLRLPKGERQLEIAYRSIDFRDARQLGYRYRLIGFDADWIEVAGRPLAVYARLMPGSYRFEVQARRTHQPWGHATAFEVEVPRMFVEGWLFRALLLLSVVAVAALAVRWRLQRLQSQKLALEATVVARTRELADANVQLEALNRSLADASVIDPLTGLRNRRFLPQEMPRYLAGLERAREQRRMDLVLGLILVDADRFKQVNDSFGHITGDQVLCQMAQAMRQAVREGDELVRWGGEEFLIVLPNLLRSELMLVAERVRTCIADSPTAPGQPPFVTASLGAAAWPVSAATRLRHDWTVALDLADFALYRAKDAGRNRSATLDVSRIAAEDWPDRPDAACLQRWLDDGRIDLLLMPEGAGDRDRG